MLYGRLHNLRESQLLIDIGNTRIKWAFWTPSVPLKPFEIAHKDANLKLLLSEAWGQVCYPPQAIYVSNVAGPNVANGLKKWVKMHWGAQAHFFVSEKERGGIKNGYQKPETLGVDRWLAMLGARARCSPPFCVIDCGSAITIDAVNVASEHLGGLILPGLTRLQTALSEECPHLPSFVGSLSFNSETLLEKNTEGGIIQGAFFMVTAAFKQVLEELQQRFGVSFVPILTGGDAWRLIPYLPKEFQHRPNLVLEGIMVLLKERSYESP